MSTTDIKRDITSETMEKFSLLPHRARHFNLEPSHATSFTLATVCRADNHYRTGKSFIGPAGWIKRAMVRLYKACRLLLIQSEIPYLYDKYIYHTDIKSWIA